jgi:hypothetical protein
MQKASILAKKQGEKKAKFDTCLWGEECHAL